MCVVCSVCVVCVCGVCVVCVCVFVVCECVCVCLLCVSACVWVCVCLCVVILLLQAVRKHFRVTRLVVKDLPLLMALKCILCKNKEICKLIEILLRLNYLYHLSENATHPQ